MKITDESTFLKKESLNKKLLKYSIAAGVVLTISAKAHADIQYTDIDPDKVIPHAENFKTSDFLLDLNNDGTPEFKIFQAFSSTYTLSYNYYFYSYNSVKAQPLNNGLSVINAIGDNMYVAALNSDELISSQQNFGKKHFLGGLSYYLTSPIGEWPDNGKRFMGVKFKIGENIHYGWVRLDLPQNCRSFTVLDYAYEDKPGVAIRAGQKNYSSEDNQGK
ncbi:MAG: hypothetical protein JW794_02095 [Candidatus Cloacimonetes bacterium]|nr:hypothetical protein [Candidatus Cloacimonadota bacterium]